MGEGYPGTRVRMRPTCPPPRPDAAGEGYRLTFVIYLAATLLPLVAPWLALIVNVAVRLHLPRIAHQHATRLHEAASRASVRT